MKATEEAREAAQAMLQAMRERAPDPAALRRERAQAILGAMRTRAPAQPSRAKIIDDLLGKVASLRRTGGRAFRNVSSADMQLLISHYEGRVLGIPPQFLLSRLKK